MSYITELIASISPTLFVLLTFIILLSGSIEAYKIVHEVPESLEPNICIEEPPYYVYSTPNGELYQSENSCGLDG